MADNVRPDAVLSAHPLLSAEIDRLRTRLAEVERALDDEEANLADDGARLSHSVVRRVRAALRGEGDQ